MASRTSRVRVAFVEQESHMGGVEVTTLQTASGLDQEVFDPRVICPQEGELVNRLREARIPVEISPRPQFHSVSARLNGRLVPNPLAILATVLSMWRATGTLTGVLRECADVVVTKGLLSHFYGGLAAARADLPCVWHVQEVVNSTHLGGLYVDALNGAARRWAHLVVVDGQSVGAQFAADMHRSKKVRLLYNGLDQDRFSPSGPEAALPVPSRAGERPLIVGNVGRIIPLKGQHVLIEAFSRLVQRWPGLHLLLVGTPLFDTDHYLKKLEEMVATYGLVDSVHFLGFRSDIPRILRGIDVFVHPSVEPDTPVSVQEAMAAGCPVVATEVAGTVELITDGIDGYLVSPDDPGALAERLDSLLSQPEERERLGSGARRTALKRYGHGAFIEHFEEMLMEVVEG